VELYNSSKRRICIIGPLPSDAGGYARAVLVHIYILRKILGYDTILIPIYWLHSLRNIKYIRRCDVVHVHGVGFPLVLLVAALWKRRIILTLHGWLVKESLISFSRLRKKFMGDLIKLIYNITTWFIYKYFLVPLVIDYVTAVSRITAKENQVDPALVIPNSVMCRPSNEITKSSCLLNYNYRIVSYVSIGGGKIESIPVAIIIVNHVKKLFELKDSEISITLEIYGKDLPDTIIKTFSHFPFVKYMGYVTDFKERIRYADLFLATYTFPELGLAVLEAICSGVPVAKLTADPTEEEIIDGFNGILATSPYEMAVKIYNYLLKRDEQKCYIAKNAISTILKKRDPQVISLYWKYIFESLLGHGR
jgi:glycosyltransferase involved in cell wall biosynthesis